MAIIRSERFNATPVLLYQTVRDIAREEIKDYYDKVVWDGDAKNGALNYMGVNGKFSITDNSELNISVTVGYPASLLINENAAGKNIEKLYERLRAKFP